MVVIDHRTMRVNCSSVVVLIGAFSSRINLAMEQVRLLFRHVSQALGGASEKGGFNSHRGILDPNGLLVHP